MRKKAFIAGGVLALILLVGSTRAFAQSSSSALREGAVISSVATKLHLSPDDVAAIKSELAAGTSIKDVLAEHNISMDDIRAALASAYPQSKHLSNTQIAAIAAKLGISATDVQAKIDRGETISQIMADYNITPDKIRAVFQEEGISIHKDKKPHAKKIKK